MQISNIEQNAQFYLLTDFVRKIQSDNPVSYKNDNQKKIRQASVALIFRISPDFLEIPSKTSNFSLPQELFLNYMNFQEILSKILASIDKEKPVSQGNIFEILFIQRSINKKDRHSGQLALPGGKCDNDESDLEAVIREVFEEIGINIKDISNKIKYLGKLNKNFFHGYYPTHTSLASLHIFFDFAKNHVIANAAEVRDYKWVPAMIFMKISKNTLILQDFYLPKLARIFTKCLSKEIVNEMEKFYKNTTFTTFDVGMDAKLWGFTLEMLIYIINMFENSVYYCTDEKLKEYFKNHDFLKNYQFATNSIKTTKIKFHKNSTFLKVFARIFELEFFYDIHIGFGLHAIQDAHIIKEKMDVLIKYALYLSLSINVFSKF